MAFIVVLLPLYRRWPTNERQSDEECESHRGELVAAAAATIAATGRANRTLEVVLSGLHELAQFASVEAGSLPLVAAPFERSSPLLLCLYGC